MPPEVKKGDIVLVRYKFDPVGVLICAKCHSWYNHVAWAINSTQVIEVRGKGVVINPINRFYNKILYDSKVVRIKNVKYEDVKKAVDEALKLHGTSHSYRKLFKSMLKIGFTKSKNIEPSTCSGMIAKCLEKYGIYFRKDISASRITPGDIEHSRRIENVKNKL